MDYGAHILHVICMWCSYKHYGAHLLQSCVCGAHLLHAMCIWCSVYFALVQLAQDTSAAVQLPCCSKTFLPIGEEDCNRWGSSLWFSPPPLWVALLFLSSLSQVLSLFCHSSCILIYPELHLKGLAHVTHDPGPVGGGIQCTYYLMSKNLQLQACTCGWTSFSGCFKCQSVLILIVLMTKRRGGWHALCPPLSSHPVCLI